MTRQSSVQTLQSMGLHEPENSDPEGLLAEFMFRANAGEEPTDIVDRTIEAIFDNSNGLNHREFHLGMVLGSIREPSVDYIARLVRAVTLDGTKMDISQSPDRTLKVEISNGRAELKYGKNKWVVIETERK